MAYSVHLVRSTPTCSTSALKNDATLECVSWLRILAYSRPNRYINSVCTLGVLGEVLILNTYDECALRDAQSGISSEVDVMSMHAVSTLRSSHALGKVAARMQKTRRPQFLRILVDSKSFYDLPSSHCAFISAA